MFSFDKHLPLAVKSLIKHRVFMLITIAIAICLSSFIIWGLIPNGLQVWPPAIVVFGLLLIALLLACFLWLDFIQPIIRTRLWAQDLIKGQAQDLIAKPSHSHVWHELYESLNYLSKVMIKHKDQGQYHQLKEFTHHIEGKTRILATLYNTAANFDANLNFKDLSNHVVEDLLTTLSIDTSVVRHLKQGMMFRIAYSGVLPDCETAESLPPDSLVLQSSEQHHRLCLPLDHSTGDCLGMFSLYLGEEQYAQREELIPLFTMIAKHLSKAIEDFRLKEESVRLTVMQERTWLANELHDTLAQTINSARVHLRLLEQNLQSNDQATETNKMVKRVDEAMLAANHEVRHLIDYFSHPDKDTRSRLNESMQTVIDQFRDKNPDITVYIDKFLSSQDLPKTYETQVVQILKEALINIEKHGCASFVQVFVCGLDNGYYRLFIRDNGLGFDSHAAKPYSQYRGVDVMHNRAKSIHGDLAIKSERGKGTSLELIFHVPGDIVEEATA